MVNAAWSCLVALKAIDGGEEERGYDHARHRYHQELHNHALVGDTQEEEGEQQEGAEDDHERRREGVDQDRQHDEQAEDEDDEVALALGL